MYFLKNIYSLHNNSNQLTTFAMASGNVIAVYELTSTPANPGNNTLGETSMKVTERHIYGSSRLGMDVQSVELIDQQGPLLDTSQFRILGLKQYEISNHLGNVLSVVSDMKLPVVDSGLIISYTAVVVSSTDYSPFGVGLEGRSYSLKHYRYGFQNQEQDGELWEGAVNYKYRVEVPRLGKFFSVDPLCSKYPYYSPYQFSGNRVIDLVELEGLEPASPPSIMNGKRDRMVDKFRRKEGRLVARSNGSLTAGTDASRDAMDSRYGAKKWYRDPVLERSNDRDENVSRANDDESYHTARTLTDYQDNLAAAAAPPAAPAGGMVEIPMEDWNYQGAGVASIPILNSGNILIEFNFSAGDQSNQVQVFQDVVQFGRGTILSTDNLNGPGFQNSTTAAVNVANGRFLTVVYRNNGGAGGGLTAITSRMTAGMVAVGVVANNTVLPRTFTIQGDGKWGKRMRGRTVGEKLRQKITDPSSQ